MGEDVGKRPKSGVGCLVLVDLLSPRSSQGGPGSFPPLPPLSAPDKKREYFGVKKEWVDGFELIPIIDVGVPGRPVDKPP